MSSVRWAPAVLGSLLLLLSLPGMAPAQSLATIHEVDTSYAKSLEAGEGITFVWLLYNGNASDLVLQTMVAPDSGEFWVATPDPPYATIGAGESREVRLQVTADPLLQEGEATLQVTFRLSLASAPAIEETLMRTVMLTFEEAPPPVPQENKILGIFDNPLPSPFNGRFWTFLISIGIWALIAVLAVALSSRVLRRFARRTEAPLGELVLGIIRGPILLLIVAYGVVQSTSVLQPPVEVLNALFLAYNVVLILALTWLAYRVFVGILFEILRRTAERRQTPLLDAVFPLLRRVSTLIIVIIGGAALAGIFGLDLTAFIAGLGVAGIAVAFAAQETLSNFFSGVFLMLDRPFKVGDLVEINGDRCRIEKVGIRSTTLYHRPSHKLLVIPNKRMAGEMIVNLVEPDPAIRQSTSIGVAYGSDIARVKEIIVGAARTHPGVITGQEGREPYARLEEFGDSAMIFKMKFWIADADQLNRVRGEVNEAIVRQLREAGIEIPFPTRVVHLHPAGEDLT